MQVCLGSAANHNSQVNYQKLTIYQSILSYVHDYAKKWGRLAHWLFMLLGYK